MIVRNLLVRGMVAGLVAGAVSFMFARVFGEPPLEGGITFESGPAASSTEPAPEVVSRSVQAAAGLGAAYIVYGIAIGGIIALVFAYARGRLGGLGPRPTAVVVTLLGFVSVALLPMIKHPANPPASTDDGSLGSRTGLFLVFAFVSVALTVTAVLIARRLAGIFGWWNAGVASAAGCLAVLLVVGSLMPDLSETPAAFPATVLYDFRTAALGSHTVMWSVLAVVFGALVHDRRIVGSGERTSTG